MAVTETIQQILEGIDTSQYGRDMRQYIHKGIEKCYEEGSAGETDLVARNDISAFASNFASVEDDSTISRAYNENEYFLHDKKLYRVNVYKSSGTSISSGITQGFFTETSISGELMVRRISVDFNPSVSFRTKGGTMWVIPLLKLVTIDFECIPSQAISADTAIIQNVPEAYWNAVGHINNESNGDVTYAKYTNSVGAPYSITCGALATNAYHGTISYYVKKYNTNHPLSSWNLAY